MANIQILGKFKSVTEDEILADAREIEVDDERISSTPQRLTDILAGIGGDAGAALAKTGGTMLGNINMGENKITNLDAPENNTDAATKKYVDDETAKKAPINHASTATTYGVGDATNYGHVKLSDATNNTSGASGGTAASPAAVKAAYDLANAALPKSGGTMTGDIAMGGNKMTGLGAPSADTDAANKKYVDDNFLAATLKGASNGVAELDANGKVPASQLPSYVDDVLEYAAFASFPAEGEAGKIYVDKATNKTYRWGGTAYTEISASLALGETASTAYAGDKGKEAHDLASAALPKSGGTMSGIIAMGGNKITGLANGTSTNDAVNKGQLDAVSGAIPAASADNPLMDGTASAGTASTWAKGDHVHPHDTTKLDKAGDTMSGSLEMSLNKITGLANGSDERDAVNFKQLSAKLNKDGDTMAGNLAMGSYKITGLAPGTATNDAVNKSQLDAVSDAIPTAGTSTPLMDGTASAGGATTTAYARADHRHPSDTSKLNKSGDTMGGDLAMGSNKITGLASGTENGDAVNKSQLDAVSAAIPAASATAPKMDGTASAGTATTWAKGDHVHPTDTSRQAKITASGLLKGDGLGGVTAAVPETDYGTYSKPSTGIPESDLAQAVKDKLTAADAALPKAGGTMTGNIAMGGNKVTGLGTPSADADAATKKYVDDNFIAATLKGANNGVAELDATGKVPASQLPSYVDDVIEGYYYNNKFYKEDTHTTEIPGETGKIYVNLDTERTYRWGGTAYAEISASIALGETASTAYAGNKGKEAHDLASAALPKAGGTMSGDIAMGNHKITGLANGQLTTDAATVGQLTGLIQHQTATIGTSATSAVINLGGGYYTCFNAYAAIGNERVCVDIEVNEANGTVTFSTAQSPTSAVTCHVFYFHSASLVPDQGNNNQLGG